MFQINGENVMKKYIVGILLTLSVFAANANDLGAFVLGTIIGSGVYRAPVYVYPQQPVYAPPPIVYQISPPPPPVYQISPPVIYVPVPVIISPSQAPYYDPALHGYCAPYHSFMYAQCMDNARRRETEDYYRRHSYR
jgi:hypothetical protein